MTIDVLVTGAGPVGLTMAAELKRYGLSVRIIDKAAQPSDKSKALVVWSRTLELLERAGCAEALVAAGMKGKGANIIAAGKPIAHVALNDVASPYSYALLIPQSETERVMTAHLANLGVTVERSVELLAFTDHGGSVAARLRHADGSEGPLEARWLVGCDGAHSTVRHMLGLAFQGETLQSDWILADLHLADLEFPPDELAMFWHEDGLLAVFPIKPGRYRVIADIGASKGAHPPEPTLEEVQEIIKRRGPAGMTASDPVWLSGFRINERKVKDYRKGSVFLAGDAAHVHSPAGGQGMNTGMQDAINLAWKLAMAQGGNGGAKLLYSYSVERSAVGDLVLAQAGRMTSLATVHNHAVQTVRNLAAGLLLGLSPVQHAMAETLSEISIGYKHSPLNGPHAHGLKGPAPGARMPPEAGVTPPGSGDVPRFALFANAGEATGQLLRDYPTLLDAALRPPPDAGGIWLVRPDGYVAAVSRQDDAAALGDYLGALLAA